MISISVVVPLNVYRRVNNPDYKLLRRKLLQIHPARRRLFFAIMRGRKWTEINCQEALEEARRTKPSKCDEQLGWYSAYGDQKKSKR